MPIHEYRCQDCGEPFEKLVRASDGQPECPCCHSVSLERLLSVFATAGAGESRAEASAAPGPCGTCGNPAGPGACAWDQ